MDAPGSRIRRARVRRSPRAWGVDPHRTIPDHRHPRQRSGCTRRPVL